MVDSEVYLLRCMRYIELNPVRAGMVPHSGECYLSSYSSNRQHGRDVLIENHPVYTSLGSDMKERRQNYRQLFLDEMCNSEVDEIR